MGNNERIDVVILGSDDAFEGDGPLWEAVEGEPKYRRVIHSAPGTAISPKDFPTGVDVWLGHQIFGEPLEHPASAFALLAVGQEGQAGFEESFDEWMQTDHVPTLSTMPDVYGTARYAAVNSTPASFAIYYMKEPDTLDSPEWIAARSTPERLLWSTQTQKRVRGVYAISDDKSEL